MNESRSIQYCLLKRLSDGRFHSGQQLAKQFNLSRTRIWQMIKTIQGWGVSVDAVPGQGYRMAGGLSLLDKALIMDELSIAAQTYLQSLTIFESIDSTNTYLLKQVPHDAVSGTACFAESQTRGRGRYGHTWVSPFGHNLYVSLLHRFHPGVSLAGLSLALGVAVAKALDQYGISDVCLKWPNDVLWQRRKLAGILVEVVGDLADGVFAVVGVGLNVHMLASEGSDITQPWIDLTTILGQPPRRNKMAGLLLNQMIETIHAFDSSGFSRFLPEWQQRDALKGQYIKVTSSAEPSAGRVLGVDEAGYLLIEQQGQPHRILSGHIYHDENNS